MKNYKVKFNTAMGNSMIVTLDESQVKSLLTANTDEWFTIRISDRETWHVNLRNITLFDILEEQHGA